MGKQMIYTSNWHDGDTVEIRVASTLEQTDPTVPRVRLVVGAGVDFSGDSFSFPNGSSIEVRPDGTLTIASGQTVTIGQNSSLRLHPHSINGSGTIRGEFAQLDAPMAEVFAPSVNVTGHWLNDRIFPQWFGAVAYPSLAAASATGSVCSAKAIERAAGMAVGGEVFIPVGYYAVKEAIKIPTGVKLRGASSLDFVDNKDLDKTKDCFGTVLVATSFPTKEDEDDYMIRINADESLEWDRPYPRMCSGISHLSMYNNDSGNSTLGAIYAADSARFDDIVFQEFCRAVKYADIYLDNKAVTNCTFYLNSAKDRQYAFDFGYLGDALLFEHNAIHTGAFNLGIKINGCGGGSVNANIINADNLIRDSKGIDFSANHIERGHILEIQNSQVTTRSNYFWLGQMPSVQISGSEYGDQSVVSMDGDAFIFYGTKYYSNDIFDNLDKFRIASEISIDQNTQLNLNNIFRYRYDTTFGKSYPTGVLISNKDGVILEAFERFSYKLSRHCQIAADYVIEFSFCKDKFTDTSNPILGMANDGIYWVGEPGEYVYCFQALTDKTRKIGWPENTPMLVPFFTAEKTDNVIDISQRLMTVGSGQDSRTVYAGVLFRLQSSINAIVRLIRLRKQPQPTGAYYEFVDVPVCGTPFLYDNGLSINGYAWREYEVQDIISSLNNAKSVVFHNLTIADIKS